MSQEFRYYSCGGCGARHNILIESDAAAETEPCGKCGDSLVLQRSIPFHGDPEALG